MKKIVLMAAIAMCAAFTSQIQAQATPPNDNELVKEEDKFYEIDITNMPQLLQDGINKNYQDCLIEKVYVSNNSTYIKYKVILKTREQKEIKVYFDDKGVVIKEHLYYSN